MSWFHALFCRDPSASDLPEPVARFAARDGRESVTLNNLDAEMVEFVGKLADAEGDALSVFMRKRFLEGLGSYLASRNKGAWKAYKLIAETRETF